MNSSNDETGFLEDFKRFVAFLQSLWGILAGISMFFPLSNSLAQVVPLASWDQGGLAYFSPQLVTMAATLVCLFVLLWTFGQRYQFAKQKRRLIYRRAWRTFIPGFIALMFYITLHYAIKENMYFVVLGWESDDLRRMLGDVVLLIAYSAFFAMITRDFVLRVLVEFLDLNHAQ